jgi:hypothetical protein
VANLLLYEDMEIHTRLCEWEAVATKDAVTFSMQENNNLEQACLTFLVVQVTFANFCPYVGSVKFST